MSFHRRIRIIYWKELVDILRDRRTLIAMIVVPIVLYPLLMLGSIQAVSYQAGTIRQEKLRIGVISEMHARSLMRVIEQDRRAIEQQRKQLDPESEEAAELPEPVEAFDIVTFDSEAQLDEAITRRAVQVGFIIRGADQLVDAIDYRNRVELKLDKESVRSTHAEFRLRDVFQRTQQRALAERKREAHLPPEFDQPFELAVVDLSAPSSILGQILPLILILMTITGAIYPAIDLTAGERERGTLESLMACPVPVIDLIVGKFLVVTTVAIMGAALNLTSVSATVYVGGFDRVIATPGGGLPVRTMIFILLCLIPFAVLMSAIMIAVCSYARTFKEAQNYVTPVILAVLVPGGIAALPATRLDGVMLVMPVGNMVLLARDLLLGAIVLWWQIALVLASTTLYAAAAVAVAANIFGQESVVFSDAGSLSGQLNRRNYRPVSRPSVSMGLLFVALLFPAWFFVQSAFSPGPNEDVAGLLYATGCLMPVLFVLIPAGILWYRKVNVADTFALRAPSVRHLAAGLLVGISAWVPAHELSVLQQRVLGVPEAVLQSAEALAETIRALPVGSVIVLLAVVPAVCEELLFRGWLLSSLSTSLSKWTAIVLSAVVFGVFHFLLFKFAVTAALGVVLAYLCWQSRSILPGMIAHLLHNTIGSYSAIDASWRTRVGISEDGDWAHLPAHILIVGGLVFMLGLLAAGRATKERVDPSYRPVADLGHT